MTSPAAHSNPLTLVALSALVSAHSAAATFSRPLTMVEDDPSTIKFAALAFAQPEGGKGEYRELKREYEDAVQAADRARAKYDEAKKTTTSLQATAKDLDTKCKAAGSAGPSKQALADAAKAQSDAAAAEANAQKLEAAAKAMSTPDPAAAAHAMQLQAAANQAQANVASLTAAATKADAEVQAAINRLNSANAVAKPAAQAALDAARATATQVHNQLNAAVAASNKAAADAKAALPQTATPAAIAQAKNNAAVARAKANDLSNKAQYLANQVKNTKPAADPDICAKAQAAAAQAKTSADELDRLGKQVRDADRTVERRRSELERARDEWKRNHSDQNDPPPAQPSNTTVIVNPPPAPPPPPPRWGVVVGPGGGIGIGGVVGGGSSQFAIGLPIYGPPQETSTTTTIVHETVITQSPPQQQELLPYPDIMTPQAQPAPILVTTTPPAPPSAPPPAPSPVQTIPVPSATSGAVAPDVARAIDLMRQGKTDPAIADLKSYVALNENDADALRWLALGHMIRGELATASVLMTTAYTLNPALSVSPMRADYFPDGENGAFARFMSAVTFANNKKTSSGYFTAAVMAQAAGRNDASQRMLDRARSAGLDPAVADPFQAAIKR